MDRGGSGDMKETERLANEIAELFTKDTAYEEITQDEYVRFSYPKHIGLMTFGTRLFRVRGFGHLMTMRTDTIFGMKLLTCSFMPSEGRRVPYLLIDIMLMEKKRMIFVEYYDWTKDRASQPSLERVAGEYSFLPDHVEKPAWYIGERTDYSLIKSLDPQGEPKQLARFVGDCVRAYKKAEMSAAKDPADLEGLMRFRRRMVDEGNPSSAVLKRVFGEKGAEEFFLDCVMPINND